jgi:hypothetical protein
MRNDSSEPNFLKRRTFAQGKVLADAAHLATHRLYCDALRFWRHCARPACKRHRHCCGDATSCLERGMIFVPPSQRLRARRKVIAGGTRRIPPQSHIEWQVRRGTFQEVVSWDFG